MSAFRFVLLVSMAVTCLHGHPSYVYRIPNGHRVPYPRRTDLIWRGVGHENPLGGGPLNPFGIAFQRSNYRWTKALCLLDSDGDGRTNGVELGDPGCTWSEGKPSPSGRITHPGFAD